MEWTTFFVSLGSALLGGLASGFGSFVAIKWQYERTARDRRKLGVEFVADAVLGLNDRAEKMIAVYDHSGFVHYSTTADVGQSCDSFYRNVEILSLISDIELRRRARNLFDSARHNVRMVVGFQQAIEELTQKSIKSIDEEKEIANLDAKRRRSMQYLRDLRQECLALQAEVLK